MMKMKRRVVGGVTHTVLVQTPQMVMFCFSNSALQRYVKFHPSDVGFGLAPVLWKHEKSPSLPLPLDPTKSTKGETLVYNNPTK